MRKIISLFELQQRKYYRLRVVSELDKIKSRRYFYCICDCGNTTKVELHNLIKGKVKSCGCYRIELKTKHGLYKSKLYTIWSDMKSRCFNKNDKNHKNYGERGIVICKEWLNDFMSFYNWSITNGYTEDLTIDRINNDGNYEPSNCRWVNRTIQNNNMRTVKNAIGYYRHGRKFRAQISIDNKTFYIGSFNTDLEAREAYKTFKNQKLSRLAV